MPEYKGHNAVTRPSPAETNAWHSLTCGHCGRTISGAVVAHIDQMRWIQCTACGEGSVISGGYYQYPGPVFGPVVEGLPTEVEEAYSEARRCFSINAFTASELLCRKLLMHIGVDKGANEGLEFVKYLDYLAQAGYVTPPIKKWADLIRQHGNKATHRLATPDRQRAESTLLFTAELLRIIYEMDFIAQKYGTVGS